jgi:AmiR/NasT family two-component response regulator
MRVLYVAGGRRTGSWLAEAFAADSASEVMLEYAEGAAQGASRLRDESFDAVLISHEPETLDSLELIEGLRGGGIEEPVIVLGEGSSAEMESMAFEVGADAYVDVDAATTRTLIWLVARAMERHHLIRENRRHRQTESQRFQQEQNEAIRRLTDQRELIGVTGVTPLKPRSTKARGAAGDSSAPGDRRSPEEAEIGPLADFTPPPDCVPAQVVEHYGELLRTSVIMGCGNLGNELATLTRILACLGVQSGEALQLHLHAVEHLVQGLGSRSARHVMTRADQVALEVMLHLSDSYRNRLCELLHPKQQRTLPGFGC